MYKYLTASNITALIAVIGFFYMVIKNYSAGNEKKMKKKVDLKTCDLRYSEAQKDINELRIEHSEQTNELKRANQKIDKIEKLLLIILESTGGHETALKSGLID